MFEVVKNVIQSGSFELSGILSKIDTLWIQGSLTESERQELIGMARGKADPAQSFAPLQTQIDALALRVKALEEAGAADSEAPGEEWPVFVTPTGAHDAYHYGSRVTYNGIHYLCIAPEGVAVVWSPDVYPGYWERVTA